MADLRLGRAGQLPVVRVPVRVRMARKPAAGVWQAVPTGLPRGVRESQWGPMAESLLDGKELRSVLTEPWRVGLVSRLVLMGEWWPDAKAWR